MGNVEEEPRLVEERQKSLKTLTICIVVLVAVVVATGLSVMISLLLQPNSKPDQMTLKLITDLQSRIESLQTDVERVTEATDIPAPQPRILRFIQKYELSFSQLARRQVQIYDQLKALESKTQDNEALRQLNIVAEVAMEAHILIEELTDNFNLSMTSQNHLQEQLQTTRKELNDELEMVTTRLVGFINNINEDCRRTAERLQMFEEKTRHWMENRSLVLQNSLNETKEEIMEEHLLDVEQLSAEIHEVESVSSEENKNATRKITELMVLANQVENLTQAVRKQDGRMAVLLEAGKKDCYGSAVYRYNPYSHTCYRIVNITKSWQGAKDYCETVGERLATFLTPLSSDWLIAQCRTGWCSQDMWVGGYKHAGDWFWASLESGNVRDGQMLAEHQVQDVDWAWGEPNSLKESAMCMQSWARQWFKFDDTHCSLEKAFICEFI